MLRVYEICEYKYVLKKMDKFASPTWIPVGGPRTVLYKIISRNSQVNFK